VSDFPDLPGLEVLGRQIEAAAARQARRRAPWSRRRIAVLALALLPVAATAAYAAVRAIEVGTPVPRYPGRGANGPLSQLVPGSSRLVAVRAPDPAGGLPLGIRVFRVRSGVTCVQVGRVLDGRVGVIGADRRFHALPAQPALAEACGSRDAAGHLFYDGLVGPPTASADPRGSGGAPRDVVWGFAGPLARTATVTIAGRRLTQHVRAADDGAYLVVLAGRPARASIETVYADGRRCAFGRGVRVDLACIPPPGYAR
jgi:hypothetical protein